MKIINFSRPSRIGPSPGKVLSQNKFLRTLNGSKNKLAKATVVSVGLIEHAAFEKQYPWSGSAALHDPISNTPRAVCFCLRLSKTSLNLLKEEPYSLQNLSKAVGRLVLALDLNFLGALAPSPGSAISVQSELPGSLQEILLAEATRSSDCITSHFELFPLRPLVTSPFRPFYNKSPKARA